MADPDPYVQAKPNDIITSDKWNQIQIQGRTELYKHNHTGGANGPKITGDGIDPAANVAVSTLKVAGKDFAAELTRLDTHIDTVMTTTTSSVSSAMSELTRLDARIDTVVPLGTVIPWWRPAATVPLPVGFEVCDGRTLAAAQHGFRLAGGAPLNQPITLPDLRNAFVLGANSAITDSTAGTSGDQVTNAPGIGGRGGSNTARPVDHHHDVKLNHTHGASATADASRSRVTATPLGTDAQGAHNHSVPGGAHIAWIDGQRNNTTFPTLTDPKPNWLPLMPDVQTNAVGAHAHNVSPHDHDMAHIHSIGAIGFTGVVRSEGMDTSDPRSIDPVPRYVGLLYLVRVR